MLKEGMFIQGRYEIVGKIGAGGMADVYKARDHKLNRFVAVKVLKAEFREDKAFITKFRAEAQAAAGLAHPNIVNIYDVGEEKGVYFIVMELVEGITLKEYIAKKGRLAVREATSIAIQVSQGLEAAHNSGIIHRDVKPQNIIISTDGKVKVTDFGIARAATNNTISTAVMGSVHYTSPEQARGGYSDAKSDIYSLGITLYEMLTGHVPFDGDSTVAIAIKHLQEEMKSPEVYVADLPRSTVQIIYKCTQKSPDRRYANMAELIRDLKESLVNPEGDFVQIATNPGGRTVVISKEELGAIKEGYNSNRGNQENVYHPVNPAENNDNYGNDYQGEPTGAPYRNGYGNGNDPSYDPYTYGMDSRAYGNRGYDYQGENRSYQYEEDDDGILNPKLEKIMTVGSVIIAILIAAIFLGLIANALGIFKFSLPGLFTQNKTTTATETQVGNSTTNGSSDTTSGQVQQNETTAVQTQTETTAVSDTQSETESATTESETESPIQIESGSAEIPNVTGKDYDTAVDELMQAGFYVSRQDDASDTVAAGTVISQSMTGNATPGSTVILIVSSGPEQTSTDGMWMCNAQLESPSNYNGQAVRLILEQDGEQTVLMEGVPISFPYDLSVQGAANESTGRVYLYVYNDETGDYELLVTYDNIPFSQVN